MTSKLTELSLLLKFEFDFEVLEQFDNDPIVSPEKENVSSLRRKYKSNL